jgi:hypothetical protein
MALHVRHFCTIALTLLAIAPGRVMAQNYPGYPNTIMAPEPGTRPRHAVAAPSLIPPAETAPSPVLPSARRYAVRGSSGSVLPTPLPRTQLIPPEGSGRITLPASPQAQGPSSVPGLANSIPNLPHGTETFQDRASRCSFQSGLYGVPGDAATRYMGTCTQ